MQMPEPIYPELVEEIKAEYAKKIEFANDDTQKAALQSLCDLAVAKEIGRQRQEAIAQGGELGERIKAENDAMQKELEAKMDPETLASIRKWQKDAAEAEKRPSFCPNCGTPIRTGKFCPNCGVKLF